MSQRSSFLSGLSSFQVLAGALAAMTSAWVASFLGVAGTIIGAALGSLVVSISSAFYANTLHKGRTLVVQTSDGEVVEKPVEEGDTAAALAEVDEETDGEIADAEILEEEPTGPPWRRIVVSTVVVLVISLVAIVGYEQVSDRSFGANAENARITSPFGGGSSSGSGQGQQDDGRSGFDADDDADSGTDDSDTDSDDGGVSQHPRGEQQTEPPSTPAPTPTPTPTPTQRPTPAPTEAPE